MKVVGLAAAIVGTMLMSSCSSLSFSVETLVNAPKLTVEQSAIHQALIESVGSNITLKYPKNGENRSAFVIANIDDEDSEEALVFYEYTSNATGKDGLRINLLDRNSDGEWYSVKEIAGAGADIDKVIVESMGSDNKTNVVVGYMNPVSDDKNLEIYSYDGKDFKRVGVDTYSILETLDINNDNDKELITIQKNTGNGSETDMITASVSMLKPDNDRIVKSQGVEMCSNVKSYVNSVVGNIEKGRPGIFIDGVNADGNLQTEIVYYRYSNLQNPMQQRSDKLLPLCTRPSGYLSADIDDDGIVEIPSVSPMTGYENAVSEEMLYMTAWNVYKDFYNVKQKYSGYYSISDGYFFAFPNRWNNQVTVKKDAETGEMVFYKYAGDINQSSEELMRIASANQKDSEKFESDGYELIDSMGMMNFYVLFPADKRDKIILTNDEVKNNFYIINK